MIFKLSSFLTLAFALSFLDAVTAISMPRSVEGGQLNRRGGGNVQITYFNEMGAFGACGSRNSDWDFVVALASTAFDNGSNCHKTITITYNGVSVSAVVTDLCPGCGGNNIDVTPAVFLALNKNSLDAGRLYGAEWHFD